MHIKNIIKNSLLQILLFVFPTFVSAYNWHSIDFKRVLFLSSHTNFIHVYPKYNTLYLISGNSNLFSHNFLEDYKYNYNVDVRAGLGLRASYNKMEFMLSYSSILNQYYSFMGYLINQKEYLGYKIFSGSQIYALSAQRNYLEADRFSFWGGISCQYEYFRAFQMFALMSPTHYSSRSHALIVSFYPMARLRVSRNSEFNFKVFPFLGFVKAKGGIFKPERIYTYIQYRCSVDYGIYF